MGTQAAFECAALFLPLLWLPVLFFVGSRAQGGKSSLQIFERLRFRLEPLFFNNCSFRPDEFVVLEIVGISAWDGGIQPCGPRMCGVAGVACTRVSLLIYRIVHYQRRQALLSRTYSLHVRPTDP